MKSKEDPQQPPATIRQDGNRPRVISESWDGPIPPPAIMAQLDELVPGTARDIIADLLESRRHERGLEVAEAENNRIETRALAFDIRLGRIAATLFPYSGLGFSAWFASQGWLTLAGIVAATTIGSVVVATLARRRDPPQ